MLDLFTSFTSDRFREAYMILIRLSLSVMRAVFKDHAQKLCQLVGNQVGGGASNELHIKQ